METSSTVHRRRSLEVSCCGCAVIGQPHKTITVLVPEQHRASRDLPLSISLLNPGPALPEAKVQLDGSLRDNTTKQAVMYATGRQGQGRSYSDIQDT